MAVETHPFVHFALGERPYFILVRYSAGVRDIDRLLGLLRDYPCKRSCCVNHLSGDYDLAISVWIPVDEERAFLDQINSLAPARVAVYPIERMSTPFQRTDDIPATRRISMAKHFHVDREAERWVYGNNQAVGADRNHGNSPGKTSFRPSFCRDRPDLSSILKFHVVIKTRSGDAGVVFASLKKALDTKGEPNYSHWTACTYRTKLEEGCIVSAYTTSDWPSLRMSLLELLKLPRPVETATYICFDEPIAEDQPWEQSRWVENKRTIEAMGVCATDAILGVHALRATNPALVPSLERLLADPAVQRSLLTYVPEYWWQYKRDVSSLIQCLASNDGEAFCRQLRDQYIRIDRELCDGVRRLFTLRGNYLGTQNPEQTLERLILNEMHVVKFEANSQILKEASAKIKEHADFSKAEREWLRASLGKVLGDYRSFGTDEARLMLGRVGDVIQKVCEMKLLMPRRARFLDFREDDLMQDWRGNLSEVAKDRNLLVHGEVLDAFETDEHGRAYWQRFLAGYIKTMPQIQVLLNELKRAHAQREGPIRLPLNRPRAGGAPASGKGLVP